MQGHGPDAPQPLPLLPQLWNCLARAGASQYHGHGQLMLTRVPVPAQAQWDAAAARHATMYAGRHPLSLDLMRAHRAAGLLRCCRGEGSDRAWVAAAVAPLKDMEVR